MLDFCPPLTLTTSTAPLVTTQVLKRISCLECFFVTSTTNLQRFSTLDRASLDVFTNQLCHHVSTCVTFRRLCPCSLLRSCEHHPGSKLLRISHINQSTGNRRLVVMELLEDISVQVATIQIAVFDQWSWSCQLSDEQKEARLPGWMQGQGSA
jgi:hypothetical protein